MKTNEDAIGNTTVDPDVILTIIRLAALEVPGVCRMASGPAGIDDLVKKFYSEGVKIDVEDHTIYVDLFLVIYRDVDLRSVARKVQEEVSRSIEDLVGMNIGRVDVHIEDIEFRKIETA
ncbi:MAG TPA: Asp23/Gls24 family envelope stress response protein [Anaerolineaceae bacterium]|uniref:Alkaline shock protein n=1 Tax=Anaerolinea thermophila TaxID=167964 RepID=A0A101FYM2_9CHLR|nr:MAG: hypothetical protein XD73_0233 [Anaerolinea thermophila]HAF61261.1 Asp23/Gls24 family envelope stress response protein [Anaerolineaceae bacterium]